MAAITKNSKNNKVNFFFRTSGYNWLKVCMEHQWDLGIQVVKMKQKIYNRIRSP